MMLLMIVVKLLNRQTPSRMGEHLGWLMLETVAWGSVKGNGTMRGSFLAQRASPHPPGPTSRG